MAKIALYQKYRSADFDEVVGQEYIVRSIKNAVRENKIGHAYLFCGPRGTGKTTMARILAKAVNCENPEKAPCGECSNCIAAINGVHPDIIEINAANETHVEDIRDLIERSRLAPMQGKHKIYIVDEVHQLSSAASSALLKTLEEPPENVIFILATTDPQKLLPTIISRCQRYDFSKVRKDQIRDHLLNIAEKEGIYCDAEAAEMIAVLADGGMRDALSIMDQCASYTSDHITVEDVDRIYGLSTVEEKTGLLKDIFTKNIENVIERIRSYESKGIDFQRFNDGLIEILKACVVYSTVRKSSMLKILKPEDAQEMLKNASESTCMHVAEKLLDTKEKLRTATSAASCFEVICLGLMVEASQPVTVIAKSAEKPVNTEVSAVQPVKSAPEKTVEINNEPAAEETEKPVFAQENYQEPESLQTEDILSLLVQCSKSDKADDEIYMKRMDFVRGIENKKYTSILKDTVIGASGKDCVLLIAGSQAVANRINSDSFNRELYFFAAEQLKIDKMFYAVTKDDFLQASKAFMARMKEGTLPEKKNITRYQKEKEAEQTSEEKVLALFGEDSVELMQ